MTDILNNEQVQAALIALIVVAGCRAAGDRAHRSHGVRVCPDVLDGG